MFQRNEGGSDNWGEVNKLLASDARAFDDFGWSVAVNGDAVVVGAYGEDAGGNRAGAAYVFDLLQSTPTRDVNCDGGVNALDAALILQFDGASWRASLRWGRGCERRRGG